MQLGKSDNAATERVPAWNKVVIKFTSGSKSTKSTCADGRWCKEPKQRNRSRPVVPSDVRPPSLPTLSP